MKSEVIAGLKKLYEEWCTLTTGYVRPTKRFLTIRNELINRIPALIGEIEILERSKNFAEAKWEDWAKRCEKAERQTQILQRAIAEIQERIATADRHNWYDYDDCASDIKLILIKVDKEIKEES